MHKDYKDILIFWLWTLKVTYILESSFTLFEFIKLKVLSGISAGSPQLSLHCCCKVTLNFLKMLRLLKRDLNIF